MKNRDFAYVATFIGLMGAALTFAWILGNG
jgi:hypothetical protein